MDKFHEWLEIHWWKLLIVYVVVGLLTFGNSWNDSLKCDPLPENWTKEQWDVYWHCTYPMSPLRGVLWPFIFIGEAAIYVTK